MEVNLQASWACVFIALIIALCSLGSIYLFPLYFCPTDKKPCMDFITQVVQVIKSPVLWVVGLVSVAFITDKVFMKQAFADFFGPFRNAAAELFDAFKTAANAVWSTMSVVKLILFVVLVILLLSVPEAVKTIYSSLVAVVGLQKLYK